MPPHSSEPRPLSPRTTHWRSPWDLDADLPSHGPVPKSGLRKLPDTLPDEYFDDIREQVDAANSLPMGGILVLAVVTFLLSIGLWVFTRDGETEWDEDLLMTTEADRAFDLPPEKTPPALDRLKLALDSAQPFPADLPLGSPAKWGTPALARAASINSLLLDNVRDLISETTWDPRHPAWVRQDLSSHPNWPILSHACAIAAAYHVHMKQDEAAVSIGLDILTVGRRLQGITTLPTYYARALSLHRSGCMVLASALQSTSLQAADLEKAQDDFEHCAPLDGELKVALDDFYRFEKGLLAGPLSDGAVDQLIPTLNQEHPLRLFFKTNITLALLADSFRELKDNLAKPPYQRHDQISARLGPEGLPRAVPGHPNYTGLRHANQRIWPYSRLLSDQTLAKARQNLVLSLFAIRRHATVNGAPPNKLEDLVPKFLPAQPVDPFTGEPLVYDLGHALIYSVGSDTKSEGGRKGGSPLEDDLEPTIALWEP